MPDAAYRTEYIFGKVHLESQLVREDSVLITALNQISQKAQAAPPSCLLEGTSVVTRVVHLGGTQLQQNAVFYNLSSLTD